MLISNCERAVTSNSKGDNFADLTRYIFERVPGIQFKYSKVLDPFKSGEIDIVFWNRQYEDGLYFLPRTILVECKNLKDPVSSDQLIVFINKVEQRGQDYGVLVSAKGITGDPEDLTGCRRHVSDALRRGKFIIIITMDDIRSLAVEGDLVELVQRKLCELIANSTFV